VLEQYPNDVKLVFKNFPLTRIHKYSMDAAIAALAANKQGKFWEFHAELFKNYNKLSEEKINEIAQSLGLDLDQFKKDRENPVLAAMVQRDLKEGVEDGVRGTPTIFINGRMLKQRSLAGFKQLIDEELAKKKEE
jgi:protein-disulfide isomerase